MFSVSFKSKNFIKKLYEKKNFVLFTDKLQSEQKGEENKKRKNKTDWDVKNI